MFPQNLSRLLPFNFLDCLAIDFDTVLIQFPRLCFELLVYKWSPVYSALTWRRMILHWQMTWSKPLNEGMLILTDLALLVLSYVTPITAISQFPEY